MLRPHLARTAITSVAACALLLLALTAAAAQATVSQTQITSPADHAVIVVNRTTPGPEVTVTGTAPGASDGDTVDILCTHPEPGKPVHVGKLNKTPIVVSGQAFSYTGSFEPIAGATCFLRAVPAGTEPANLSPFSGPELAIDENEDGNIGPKTNYQVAGGPNDGALFDYYFWGAQFHATGEYLSLTSCGLCDSYAIDPATGAKGQAFFYSNAALFSKDDANKRSEIQIDGNNAFSGESAARLINRSGPTEYNGSEDYHNFPGLTYSEEVDPLSGDVTLHEEAAFVRCAEGATFGYGNPHGTPCADFVPTGVSYSRRIVQNRDGALASVFDTFTSTDHAAHHLDLLYFQSVRKISVATNPVYEFPWISGAFTAPSAKASITPPPGPATIFAQEEEEQEEGNESLGKGAITLSAPPTEIKFGSDSGSFELHYLRTLPADGSVKIGQAFSTAFALTEVRPAAQQAQLELSPSLKILSPATTTTLSTPTATVTGTVTAAGNDLPSTVSVNGQAVPVGPSGSWSAPVALAVGANTITATATDEYGLSASAQISLTYAPPTSGTPPPSPPVTSPAATATITETSYDGHNLLLTVSCHSGGATCTGSIGATATQKLGSKGKKGRKGHRPKAKQITVASGSFAIASGQTETIKLKLSGAAASLLAHLGRLASTVTLSLDQATSARTVTTEQFTLRPKKAKGKKHHKKR